MKFIIIILAAVTLAFILFNFYTMKSVDKLFQLPSDKVLIVDVRTKRNSTAVISVRP